MPPDSPWAYLRTTQPISTHAKHPKTTLLLSMRGPSLGLNAIRCLTVNTNALAAAKDCDFEVLGPLVEPSTPEAEWPTWTLTTNSGTLSSFRSG